MNVIRILENAPRWPAFASSISCRRFSQCTAIKCQTQKRIVHQLCVEQQARENFSRSAPVPESTRRHFSSSSTLYSVKPPSDELLVYKGSLTTAVHATKLISLSSSILGLSIQPYLINQAGGASIALIATVGGMVGFFTYVTPLLIHWVTKRYVVSLHFDPETSTFTCTTLSFFLYRNLMEFKASDVVMPDIPGMFTSLLVKGKPLLIDPAAFLNIEAYRHMMGYDKPMDFKLGSPDDKQS